ncbi:DNA polymerase epsilon catalytic subunit [Artemisia annua]|uniref:DNA polymerase epsilon catalytic subunit n=1 Tax=Artemisia annua TaxID=35608 RepID=A0A2U1KUA7_ARTAN|nr:DNA polymerase epsilon catalytic subunit [Artemisia annua]
MRCISSHALLIPLATVIPDYIVDLREYDVPYHVRFAIDNDIRCGLWYDVNVSSGVVTFERRHDLLQRAEVHVCAFDIETTKLPLKFPDAEYDLVMMISYMVDGRGYLIINRECVGEDINDLEYTPKSEFEGHFKVTNVKNEEELLKLWFSHMKEVKPGIYVTYNGDFFDWPFLENRAAHHGLRMNDEIGFQCDKTQGECRSKFACHLDCFAWVKRDSYLPQGSHGLKAVTKAKLGYDPLEVNPEDMVRFAMQNPQMMASYSVSDAVSTYYLYMTYVHPFIFSLATIIPMPPDEVLRKGSGTLCEMLLMVQAYTANVICPNKHQAEPEKFYNGHLLESETYIGGHVECLETGVFRSDLPTSFKLDPSAFNKLIENLDRDLGYAIRVEGKMDIESVSNYDEVKNAIMQKAYKRVLDKPVTEIREAGICMRENPFYVDTVRRGARWYSMEMAGIVTYTGAKIIQNAHLLVKKIGKPLELDTDGIWCALPGSFPENFTFKTRDSKKKLTISYPCVMLNVDVARNNTNDQYQTLKDPVNRTYTTHSECSIEFEVDGPYKAMILPASKEEGILIKKRYAVFNDDGTLAELKGFEIKRRGELKLIKVFQVIFLSDKAELFDKFLHGSTLEECYSVVASVANRWLDLLDNQGKDIADCELLDYISESSTMSKSLAEYGEQKSCAVTTARRLAHFLGDTMVKDKGLRCQYVIACEPRGTPVSERAVPVAIFETDPEIMKFYLKKWCKVSSDIGIRSIIDWSYYKQRLSSAIQKIITIPAAMQKVSNPVPRVVHPDWLHKKVREKDDKMRQRKLADFFGSVNMINKDDSKNDANEEDRLPNEQNVVDLEDFGGNRKSSGVGPIPIVRCYETNHKTSGQGASSMEKPDQDKHLDYQGWLDSRKRKWKQVREKRKRQSLTRPFNRLDNLGKSDGVNGVGSYFKRKELALTHSYWQIIQIVSSSQNGRYFAWAIVDGTMHKIPVKVPRVFYLNSKAPLSEGFPGRFVNKILPHGQRCYNLIEVITDEDQYRTEQRKLAAHLADPEVEVDYVGNTKDADKILQRTISEFRFQLHGPAIAIIECPDVNTMKSKIQALEDFPCVNIPLKACDSQFPIGWQIVAAKTGMQHCVASSRWLDERISLSRYSHVPLGNLEQDWLIYTADLLFARALRDQQQILWISDNGIPDLGGNNDAETCYADEVDQPIHTFEGAYRRVTVELKIHNLAVNALLKSHQINEMEGSTLFGLDEAISCSPAFRVLKQLIQRCLADAVSSGNIFADAMLQNLYQWLCSPRSKLHDPALYRMLHKVMQKMLALLLAELKNLDNGIPDLGGNNDAETCYADEVDQPIHTFEGAYRRVTVELKIHNLAVNALLKSHQINEMEGSTLFGLDEAISCSPAFRVLKQLIQRCLADAVSSGNIFADAMLQNLYQWLCSPRSKLHDPALYRMLHKVMQKVLVLLLAELKNLGATVIFANFSKMILDTGKRDLLAAQAYCDSLLKTLQTRELFEWIELESTQFWVSLLFMDQYNYGGVQAKSDQTIVNPQVESNWNIAEDLPEETRDQFDSIVSDFIYLPWKFAQDQANKQTNIRDDDDDSCTPSITAAAGEMFQSCMTEDLREKVCIKTINLV